MDTRATDLWPGKEVLYYPRQGRPGHTVTVVAITPHEHYGALVRFAYVGGRQRELAVGNFHRRPE